MVAILAMMAWRAKRRWQREAKEEKEVRVAACRTLEEGARRGQLAGDGELKNILLRAQKIEKEI